LAITFPANLVVTDATPEFDLATQRGRCSGGGGCHPAKSQAHRFCSQLLRC
jgi:hypothetical protein